MSPDRSGATDPGPTFRLMAWLGGFLGVHLYLVAANYYEALPLVDVPMHVLGGVFVAGGLRLLLLRDRRPPDFLPLYLLGGTLAVGLAYEALEHAAAHWTNLVFVGGPGDTLKDLAFDLVGAGLFLLFSGPGAQDG